ncbi:DUF5979 domain-containing protein [Microbacterium halophytorum]|uniref:DUF5979 domain-containing protein n=1 Tax=Microbacterium halophytorum TaxID=2067568 RepID=UPI000CFC4381|nr:DUF5979 domain-containing protein [Microbacterium halophytorum]
MNTRTRIDSRRTLAGVIIAVVLAVFASLVVAVPAQAEASASVTDLSFETDTVAGGRSAVLSGSWSVADDATGTASFQLDLPPELRGQAQSFAVVVADGSEVGVCTATNTTFRCDIDLESPYYLANPVNRSGQFEFRVDVRTEVTESTEVTYEVSEHEVTITVTPNTPGTCTNNCEFTGVKATKQGWSAGDELWWYIDPPAGVDGFRDGQTVVIEDIPVGNHTVDASSWRMFATNTIASVNGRETPDFQTVWTSQNPTDIPEQPVLSEDGRTVSFTAQEGWFYRFWLRTDASDAGASVDYTNRATITVGTESTTSVEKTNTWAGGNATGIGERLARFSLEKDVVVTGDAGAKEVLSAQRYDVRWSVEQPDGSTLTDVVTVVPGETWQSDLFPAGSVLHLEELAPMAPDGITWTSASFSQNDFVLPEQSNTLVVLTNTAVYEEPPAEDPGTDGPSTDEPDTEEPDTDQPETEEPETEEPETEEPETERPETEQPETEQPATSEQPAADEDDTLAVTGAESGGIAAAAVGLMLAGGLILAVRRRSRA